MNGIVASELSAYTKEAYQADYNGRHRTRRAKNHPGQDAKVGYEHGTRSLDQFYYHSLGRDDIQTRDENQVVTRYLIGSRNGEGVDSSRDWWPILGVDQLWLWVIDDGMVLGLCYTFKNDHLF